MPAPDIGPNPSSNALQSAGFPVPGLAKPGSATGTSESYEPRSPVGNAISAANVKRMFRRVLPLVVSLLVLLPADALGRAGGGSRGFRSPSGGGGGSRGFGGGRHFFFFGGGGGGFLLLIILVIIVAVLISRNRGRRS